MALLSIITMTEHYPDIWDDFQVPGALDTDTAKDKILLDCAELELLYSDPDILKYMIKNWTMTESHIWQKLADTLNLQYNPIYNLDVTWEETRTPNITKTRTPNLTETRTPNITEERTPNITEERIPNVTETRTPNTTTTETPTDTNTESVAGFNSSTFENSRKTTRGGNITTTETGTDTTVTSGTDKTTTTGIDKTVTVGTETKKETGTDTEQETGTETISTRRYGNQGVTMTQDMIQKERDIAQFNLYEYIAKSFKNRFCLLVY